MTPSELASALLEEIRIAYPEGGYLLVPPQRSEPSPPKRVTPPHVSPLPKTLSGLKLTSYIPTPILLVHCGEGGEMLERLATALTQKRASAQVVEVKEAPPTLFTSPLVKLVVLTPRAQAALPQLKIRAPLYMMEEPQAYLDNPALRKPLWEALCALL
ncbi:MAG: hypothetical protein AB7F31_06945 [Parachlamydiales bacterium]